MLHVGIGLDDDRGVASELESNSLVVCAAADGPARVCRAGEGDHPDAGIVDERRGVVVGAEQERDRAWRIATLPYDLAEQQGREWVLWRHFDHHRGATRNGRR